MECRHGGRRMPANSKNSCEAPNAGGLSEGALAVVLLSLPTRSRPTFSPYRGTSFLPAVAVVSKNCCAS